MHARQLHKTLSQFLITVLNTSKLAFFIWYSKEFKIFGPKALRLFAPKVTWFHLGVSRLSLYLSLGRI